MQKFPVKFVIALCSPLLAGGCALFKSNSSAQVARTPVATVTHSPAVGDANYEMGRAYQNRFQYDAAIAAYRKALKDNPRNAEARNALGVIYASQGKHEQAINELMAALAIAPTASHIQNNLGYAYLLTGRNGDAMEVLKVAAGMDPANQRVRENLKDAEKRLGIETPVAQTLPPVAAAPEKLPPTERSADPSGPSLVSVAPNIFELRQHLPRVTASAPAISPVAPAVSPLEQTSVKLEVANGSGVSGLAKRTSSSLQQKGYVIARLTNQVPYNQATTEIQYRRGQENQARRLNTLLAVQANVVESSHLSPAVGVRILLGRDIAQRSMVTDSETRQPALAKEETTAPTRG